MTDKAQALTDEQLAEQRRFNLWAADRINELCDKAEADNIPPDVVAALGAALMGSCIGSMFPTELMEPVNLNCCQVFFAAYQKGLGRNPYLGAGELPPKDPTVPTVGHG